jgi:hypothetical protein
MAVTYSRYKFVTVSITKRLRNGGFTSETATPPPGSRSTLPVKYSTQYPLELLVFQGGGDGRGYRNIYPGGRT